MVNKFSTENMSLNERLDFIEFRQELLFNNSEVDRILFENNITKEQYLSIMDVMDSFNNDLKSGNKITHSSLEQRIYKLIPHLEGNYHFCEYISRAFKDEGKWEEVFNQLYGQMPKYQGIN